MFKNYNLRTGEDGMIRGIRYLAITSWILIFTVFMLIAKAKPSYETIFERFYTQQSPIQTWDSDLILMASKLLIPLLFLAFAGLIMNSKRHKRKGDTYSKSLITGLIIALIGLSLSLSFII